MPPPPHVDHDPEQEIHEIREIVDSGLAFLAEEDGAPVGFALARRTDTRLGRLTDLYVVPDARRGGVAAALSTPRWRPSRRRVSSTSTSR